MVELVPEKTTPGFRGSETSRPQITLYSHTGDPIVLNAGQTLPFDGRDEQAFNPVLTQVQTAKEIGAASGTWSFTAKTPSSLDGLFGRIVDDDWADIVFTRHGRPFHTMRGLVDTITRDRTVSARGATQTVWTVAGRDFGKVWEQTPVWFSTYCAENVHGHFAAKVFTTRRADKEGSNVAGDTLVLGSPQAAVRGYLFGFLEQLGGIGRENWEPPPALPGIRNGSFAQSVFFKNNGFINLPARVGIDPNFIMAGGTLWDLAKEWSDPLFTELFADLALAQFIRSGTYAGQDFDAPVADTHMVVHFRDKPFVIVDPLWPGPKGLSSPWFSLPMFEVAPQLVTKSTVGRSGYERFNAFFATSPLHQESLGAAVIDLLQPMWDKRDIKRHGLRRFDISSKYQDKNSNLLNLSQAQRAMVKDWYCLNPYFLSGQLAFGRGLPELRVGVRLRVKSPAGPAQDETYYVEAVQNNWSLQPGLRTSARVTRGWVGDDQSLVNAVAQAGGGYALEGKVVAGSPDTPPA